MPTASARPTRWQYFVASAWPVRIWFAAHVVVLSGAAIRAMLSGSSTNLEMSSLALFATVLTCSAVASFPLSMLTGILLLGPWLRARGVANGAPYAVGDHVRILAGGDRGRVAVVYEIWPERHQVRVDLGDERKQRVSDVFTYEKVLRV